MARHRFRPTTKNWKRKISRVPSVPSEPVYPSDHFFDNFTGTDGASLASRVPLVRPNSNTWAVNFGTIVINSNRAEISFANQASGIATFNTGSADVTIELEAMLPSTGANSRNFGVLLRYQNNSNFWMLLCAVSNNELRLVKNEAGTWTAMSSIPFTFAGDVWYTLRFSALENTFTGSIDGNEVAAVTSTVHNTLTAHGFRAGNTLGQGSAFVREIVGTIPIADPLSAVDFTVNISDSVLRTSNLELTATLVDNDLNGSGTFQTTAIASLQGVYARLASFIGGFGENDPLQPWDGTGSVPLIEDMALGGIDRFAAVAAALDVPMDWIIWRHPWQFTENPSSGVNSTSSDYYGSENRRIREDRRADNILYQRRLGKYLIETHGARRFKAGSEMKGFQTDLTNGLSQTWDYVAFHQFYADSVEGFSLAADDAIGVTREDIRIGAPYPVVAHQGASDADSVNFDTRNTVTAPTISIRYKDNVVPATWSMNDPGWGYPNKAPLQAIVEHFQLCAANSVSCEMFSTDFGMFNNDNIIYPGAEDDFYVAHQRTQDHIRWIKRMLQDVAGGQFSDLQNWIDIAEVYWKAQSTIAPGNTLLIGGTEPPGPYLDEDLRFLYQGGLKATGLAVCIKEGVRSPSLWSVFGSGDGRTEPRLTGGQNNDLQRYYAAAIVPQGQTLAGLTEGQLTPVGTILKNINQNFSLGIEIMDSEISDSSKAFEVSSQTHCMLVNRKAVTQSYRIYRGSSVVDEDTIAPYETKFVAYA